MIWMNDSMVFVLCRYIVRLVNRWEDIEARERGKWNVATPMQRRRNWMTGAMHRNLQHP